MAADPARWQLRIGNDPRILIGLGDDDGEQDLFVLWPDGRRESFTELAADGYHRIEYGKGKSVDD